MSSVILASGSLTRADMLKSAGVSFTIVKPMVDEEALQGALIVEGAPPRDIADALAEAKARSVSMMHPDAFVLGADQILEQGGKIYTKAADRDSAKAVLKNLSGSMHQLLSAAVIYQNGQAIWRTVDSAKMYVRPLSDYYIETYLDKLGPDAFWSVGCYQIEGLGAQLFTRVEGSHFTVMGLPLLPLLDFLRRHGILPL